MSYSPINPTVLTTVLNNQGTLASAVNQQTALALAQNGIAIAAAIMNQQGTQANEATLVSVLAQGSLQSTYQSLISGLALSQLNVQTALMNQQGTQSTASLTTIVNNQGSQATSDLQTTGNGIASSLLNSTGTLATSALQTTGNSTASAILNDFGTLATSSGQGITNAILQAIYIQAGTSAGSISTTTLFDTQVGSAISPAVDVTGRLYNTVQHVINGTCAVTTQTSLNGIHWNTESITNNSTVLSLSGLTKYVRASASSGGTVTSLLMSSPPLPAAQGASSAPAESIFSGSISPSVGATFVLPVNNANTIGFHLIIPTNSEILFEGSWDGINWESATFRQMGVDGYASSSHQTENWIGSCATFNYLRWRTLSVGSTSGSIYGKTTYAPSTLEGIEHGAMPHRIGAYPHEVVEAIGTICTDQVIYTPDPRHRIVVSDIYLNADGNTTLTLSENGTRSIFRVRLRPTSGVPWVNIGYRVPVPFINSGTPLCLSNSATVNVDINIHLYETED